MLLSLLYVVLAVSTINASAIQPEANYSIHGTTPFNVMNKRAIIQNDCPRRRQNTLKSALASCAVLCGAGESGASEGAGGRLQKFFKDSSENTRKIVARRFDKIADECQALEEESVTRLSCDQKACDAEGAEDSFAFTEGDTITFCRRFWPLQDFSADCDQLNDEAITLLHEMTHSQTLSSQAGEEPTEDYAYGNAIFNLDASQAINNADTYAIFAKHSFLECEFELADHIRDIIQQALEDDKLDALPDKITDTINSKRA